MNKIVDLMKKILVFAVVLAMCFSTDAVAADKKDKSATCSIMYRCYTAGTKWQKWIKSGKVSGNTKRDNAIMALRIKLTDQEYSGSINYRVHYEQIGWMDWAKNGQTVGSGKKGKIEAIQIKLSGKIAKYYDVFYRTNIQGKGWTGWAKNGASAGSSGNNLLMRALQIKLVKKGETAPKSSARRFYGNSPLVEYSTSFEGTAWSDYTADGVGNGKLGAYKKFDGLKVRLLTNEYKGNIEYRTYHNNTGWQNYVKNNRRIVSGASTGVMSGVQIKLSGDIAKYYDVYYRVCQHEIAWSRWVKNGKTAGDKSRCIEAIQVFLVSKEQKVNYPDPQLEVSTIDPSKPMVALTYDDGPYSPATDRILNALEKVGGRATFFIVGNRAASYRSSIVKANELGCQLANHTWDHTSLTALGPEGINSQIDACNKVLSEITGKVPTVIRPVGGAVNSTVLATVNYPMILWSVDTLDWRNRNAEKVYNAAMSSVKDGDIILMHDIYETTAAASERIIPDLVNRGYQLVTVDELIQYKGYEVTGNKTYSCFR